MGQTVQGVAYVSGWVLLWGNAASLADFLQLERGAYDAASLAQAVTLLSCGIASTVLAVRLSARGLRQQD